MKKVLKSILVLALIMGISLGTTQTAYAATTKPGTHFYSCRAHGYGCMHVTLAAEFSGSTCTDVYWESSVMHWPNGVTFGDTRNYSSYARGTYTVYSSLITQWVSIAFQSATDTIYIFN